MIRLRIAPVLVFAALSIVSWVDHRPAATVLAAQRPAPATPAPVRHVDRAQLMRDTSTLASPGFEGRATGTPGGERARQWVVEQFRAIGLTPALPSGYIQPFPVAARGTAPTRPEETSSPAVYSAANVIGRLAGRDPRAPTMVITAHYDHHGIRDGVLYPGADDNASGVAVMLAAARHFSKSPPRHPMIFAALDAEEIGLHGAYALVRSDVLPRGRVALNVNLDMVSRSAANEIFAAGTYQSPWLLPMLQDIQRRASVRIRFGHDRPEALANGLDDWTRLSDHGAFHEAGIPFVYFGVEDHPDYHKPTDTANRIDLRFFGDAADMIVEAIRTFDDRLD